MRVHWPLQTAPYLAGKQPFAAIEASLETIRSLVGAHPHDRFQFCSSGARALCEVYQSVHASHIAENGKNHFLIPQGEELLSEVLERCLGKWGVYQKTIPLDREGQITPDLLKKGLTPKTGMVSLSWANPLTGVVQPIWELAEVCLENGVLFHVDVSQVLGKIYFKFEDLPVDYLTFEGTVIHGPKGSGGLFAKRDACFEGLLPADVYQDTLNVPALIGLGIAARELADAFDHLCMETRRLRDKLEAGIVDAVPDAQILFKEVMRLPNITCILFPGVMGELLAFHLQRRGLFASFRRSECLPRFLTGLGMDWLQSQASLIFSLSYTTTEEEIDRAIAIIVDAAQKCQTCSRGLFR